MCNPLCFLWKGFPVTPDKSKISSLFVFWQCFGTSNQEVGVTVPGITPTFNKACYPRCLRIEKTKCESTVYGLPSIRTLSSRYCSFACLCLSRKEVTVEDDWLEHRCGAWKEVRKVKGCLKEQVKEGGTEEVHSWVGQCKQGTGAEKCPFYTRVKILRAETQKQKWQK